MGAGLVALGGLSGCTQFLKRSESSVPLAPAGAGNARQRLVQLAREAKEAWKDALRDYNQWQATGDESIRLALPEKIQRAKTLSFAIIDGIDAEGLTPNLNEQFTRIDFNKVSEVEKARIVKAIIEDLSDTGLSEDEIKQWEQALLQQSSDDLDAKREEILRHGGISLYLTHQLEAINGFEEPISLASLCGGLRLGCMLGLTGNLVLILMADNPLEIAWAFIGFALSAVACGEIDRICPRPRRRPR